MQEQIVYLAKNPNFLRAVNILKSANKITDEIMEYLITHDYLEKITPTLAREKFGIEWVPTELDKYHTELGKELELCKAADSRRTPGRLDKCRIAEERDEERKLDKFKKLGVIPSGLKYCSLETGRKFLEYSFIACDRLVKRLITYNKLITVFKRHYIKLNLYKGKL